MSNAHTSHKHGEESSDSPSPTPDNPSHSSALREILTTIGVLVAALLVAVGLIVYVFQTYQVDGSSMEPTLQNSDRLIVWKVPRTWARITGHDYIPKRGDIIIFSQDLSSVGQGSDKQLVKRIIGLPGDEVVIKNGSITIYDKAHPSGFDPDTTLSYGKSSHIPYTAGNIDLTLGPHQLFVCGDNRTVSEDSRAFGPINADQIVGKLVLRVWPLNKAERF